VAAKLRPETLNAFFVEGDACIRDRLAGTFGLAGHRVEMAGHPLELCVHNPDEAGASRHVYRAQSLERLAVREGVSDSGGAFYAFGEQDTIVHTELAEASFDAAMFVVDAAAQVRNVLAESLDKVLDRLEYPERTGP